MHACMCARVGGEGCRKCTVPSPSGTDCLAGGMVWLSLCFFSCQKHLNEEDWTKEETDHLFELCQQFDLRFPVVCDRYNSWAVKVNADITRVHPHSVLTGCAGTVHVHAVCAQLYMFVHCLQKPSYLNIL